MNEPEVTLLYEFAAAVMPNDGKWNKPTTAAEIVGHAYILRDVRFELACFATDLVISKDGKWPSPWLILAKAREIDAGLNFEQACWKYEEEIKTAHEAVLSISELAFEAAKRNHGAGTVQADKKGELTR